MHHKLIYHQLDLILEEAQRIPIGIDDRWVIMSDMHMGNRTRKDDFLKNAPLFKEALKYYDDRNFKLLLNGDVEELQKFTYTTIRKKWSEVYDLFRRFKERGAFFKTVGNHDLDFSFDDAEQEFPTRDAFLLEHDKGEIFVFHGHQASQFYFRYNKFVGLILKYIANPLRIGNYSVAHNSKKKYRIEKRVYHYSAYRKVVSVIGHTHRPLFESLSKAERLKIQIENLCRQYTRAQGKADIKEIKKTIKSHKKELKKIYRKQKHQDAHSYLYNAILHIPCLFNSGTVIGKRGMTCLEIDANEIRLVHWFDSKLSNRYLNKRGYEPEPIADTDTYRMLLNTESLDYVFARIKLLG